MDLIAREKCLLVQEDYLTNLYNPIQILRRLNSRTVEHIPPDMSVLVKARKGGANYIYSLILGYEETSRGF